MTRIIGSMNSADIANFDNVFAAELPADPAPENSLRQVAGAAYSRVAPTPVSAPRLLGWSEEMGRELGIARPAPGDAWLEALAGNCLLPGMEPYAACYGGHQFGNWAGQLGDGRAISLGQIKTAAGRFWELQLKGAGLTPYSRGADGRAVLRSSLREFLCSEAMHHLGIPTTRALSLVATGDEVVRDMFYDGNPQAEPGAIVCRVAPSFLRFGSFELPRSREDETLLRLLADHCIRWHFPDLDLAAPGVYADWFAEVCRRSADLVVDWMAVGFVHGVLNTDNMSVHGLTIDYGPYGWLEPYDPAWTPNTTDAQGRRYCFGRQPQIVQWNLARLGSALTPLVTDVETLQAGLEAFGSRYEQAFRSRFAAKLGLATWRGDDETLLNDLFKVLAMSEIDYCLFFRRLAQQADPAGSPDDLSALAPAFYAPETLEAAPGMALRDWLARFHQRLRDEARAPAERRRRMDAVNPKYVLRNYLAQQAINAATEGDTGELERLQQILRHPYDEQPEHEAYAGRRPEWARHLPGCSALSCSS